MRTRRTGSLLAIACALLTGSAALCAAPVPEQVPPALRPWIEWSLRDVPDARCPRADGAGERACLFASSIVLAIEEGGATFHGEASAFRSATPLPIPGHAGAWPQDVRVDGVPAAVVAQERGPRLLLAPGTHRIEGRLAWRSMPAKLAIPTEYASVSVTFRGHDVRPDDAGIVWLARKAGAPLAQDSASTRIFRRITDDVPALVETAIELTVAGRPREIRVPLALLPGFAAQQVRGALPARLDGASLRVQAVAGTSWMYVTGRRDTPLAELALPAEGATEVWSFAAVDQIRRVEVQGPVAVDPRQAEVPSGWQQLPAWRVKGGESLRLTERHRGDAGQDTNRLTLARALWLDEDGGGITFRDELDGTFGGPDAARDARKAGGPWRLEMLAPFEIGHARLDGVDQYLTRVDAKSPAGIEVRRSGLRLEADGRIGSVASNLPVAGWSTDLQQASAVLHVAPGWRLVHASGVEHAEGAWTARWSLWDLFLLLLICVAAWRVFGRVTGCVLAAGLVLSWTVPGAPGWLWLLPIVAAAVQAAVSEAGRFGRVATFAKRAGLVVVAAGVAAFSVGQIRAALHPVLEDVPSRGSYEQDLVMAQSETRTSQAQMAAVANGLAGNREPKIAAAPAPAPVVDGLMKQPLEISSQRTFEAVDPAARVQTGTGIPSWHWRSYRLRWAGPVAPDQQMRLWLAPPWLVRLGNLVTVALLGFALWLMAGRPRVRPPKLATPAGSAATSAILALLIGISFLAVAGPAGARPASPPVPEANASEQSAAPVPDPGEHAGGGDWQTLLAQLREHLLANPPCAPTCTGISRMSIEARGELVELRIAVDAAADSAIALPGGPAWRAARNEVDGRGGDFASRGDGQVAVHVPPGVHLVTRTLHAAEESELAILLPAMPGAIDARLEGWQLSGLHEDGTADTTINLVRALRPSGASTPGVAAGDAAIAPLARVERTLSFGAQWHVETTIERIDSGNRPQDIEIALLPGESVTSSAVRVAQGVAYVTLAPSARTGFASDLAIKSPLTLQASRRPGQFEVWVVESSTLWTVRTEGIPPVSRVRGGLWSPQWRPWPGESVTLDVQRPEGIAGNTLTIDDVHLSVSPGALATNVEATVGLRSSLGATHRLGLPEGAKLTSLRLDGKELAVYAEGEKVPLRIEPGAHHVQLSWREERGIRGLYRAPRLDLGAPAVNASLEMRVPADRWLLFARGPSTGPVVLFWSMLIVLALLAAAASRWVASPLSMVSWLVLAIGAGQAGLAPALVVLGFVAATGARERWGARLDGWKFDAMQIAYVLFLFVAVAMLLEAVHNGLLGRPTMLVQGNESTDSLLRWFADRVPDATFDATLVSLPLWVWRLAMLGWSVWLSLTVMRLVKWVWLAFSAGGRWQSLRGRRVLAQDPAGAGGSTAS